MFRASSTSQYTAAHVLKIPPAYPLNVDILIDCLCSHVVNDQNFWATSVRTRPSSREPGGNCCFNQLFSSGERASPFACPFASISFSGGQAPTHPLAAVTCCSRGGPLSPHVATAKTPMRAAGTRSMCQIVRSDFIRLPVAVTFQQIAVRSEGLSEPEFRCRRNHLSGIPRISHNGVYATWTAQKCPLWVGCRSRTDHRPKMECRCAS